MVLRRGFKAEAERLALETRYELGVGPLVRLEPRALANHLEIPIITLSELKLQVRGVDGLPDAIELLLGTEASALSAMTVFDGPRRMVVHNDGHSVGRQASNIAHELAHGLLLHPPTPAVDSRGCRHWNGPIEEEANYLAGALLIPGEAARRLTRGGLTVDQVADEFGCSVEMARWRINITGARRFAKAV